MDFFPSNQPWNATVAFAAGDATKDIKAASTNASKSLVVTHITVFITTVAAQVISIEDDNGTPVVVMKIAASQSFPVSINLQKGVTLTAGKKLIYKPAAAGPAGFIVAEGYVTPQG